MAVAPSLRCPSGSIILDRIQFSALRSSLSLLPTTPSNVVLDSTGEWPLHERRCFLVSKFLVKTMSCGGHLLLSLSESFFECVRSFSGDPLCAPDSFLDLFVALYGRFFKDLFRSHLPGHLGLDYATGFFRAEADLLSGFELRAGSRAALPSSVPARDDYCCV